MDKDYYADKMLLMLSDSNTYTEIDCDKSRKTINKVKNLSVNYDSCLMDEEIDYIKNFEYKESNFYGLPKIHKSEIICEALKNYSGDCINIHRPMDLKFRPIVAGPVSPTSRLSELIDCILKDLPCQTSSYVRDDIDFLSKLPRDLPHDTSFSLTALDVTSLYTNIDHGLGLEALKYWVQKLRHLIPRRFTEKFITDAVKLILENNSFFFDNRHYLQIKGTAMGTKMAPSYVNLVLAYLEEQMYDTLALENAEYSKYIKENFFRYLDDCFIVWPKSKWNISHFVETLNNMHRDITFTYEISDNKIPFLDIQVSIQNNKISTDIYYKATDSHQYLYYKSCHPRHTKNNIPYAMARRICTIVDNVDTRNQRLHELMTFCLQQGYPRQLIMNGIEKAKAIPISELRKVKTKDDTKVLPFVFTHNPSNPSVVNLVHSTMDILHSDTRMNKVLKPYKLITSRRQPPNLRHILTRAKFTTLSNDGSSGQCKDKRCGTCPFILSTASIIIKSTGQNFVIKTNMDCKSRNVLYLITCNGCGEQYVGKTHDTLNARVRVHKQHINNPIYRKLGMSKHIDECSDNVIKFSIVPFYKLSSDTSMGKVKEEYFISKFKPFLNGLRLD